MAQDSPALILLVESDPVQLSGLREVLQRMGHAVASAVTYDLARAAAARDAFDLVLLNVDLDGNEGEGLLRHLTTQPDGPEVVVYSARGSVNHAVSAMRAGAFDFLMLPVAPEKLQVTVVNALKLRQLTQTVETYQKADRPGFQGFIGSSPVMQAVYKSLEQAASSKATVFVTGESGTGKEVAAQAIHNLSQRQGRQFVALNCAAIPKDLIESEVFGHVKGAFTGATADRDGAAKQADGGTLFLDEICEMDLNLQSKLLRFLQTGTFQRVGGSKPESVDVRIVCATNREPMEEVQAGRFREDLYYRLHVLPIGLPPLRERGADVVEIAQHFLRDASAEEGKPFQGFSLEVEGMLQHYDWPGNVRQLQNIIRNIVVMHSGTLVEAPMVPAPVGGRWARPHGFVGQAAPQLVSSTVSRLPVGDHVIRPLAEIEREAIEHAIRVCDGNIPKAAALLDVSPSTIYRKQQAWKNNGAA